MLAYGLSFALAHVEALGRAAAEAPDPEAVAEVYRAEAGPEARERILLLPRARHGMRCSRIWRWLRDVGFRALSGGARLA